MERYLQQIYLKGWGTEGQLKLQNTSVLLIGLGGLGCPALQYLSAAGIGRIGVIDGDRVALSNLHRQTLYNMEDIGRLKVDVAVEKMKKQNPSIIFDAYPTYLSSENALNILESYDWIIDGTDNFQSRYLINDACILLNKAFVYGAVFQWEGQVAVFNYADNQGIKTNYRDLFPNPSNTSSLSSCSEAGVIGMLPGIIGLMQASELIKLITQIGDPLIHQVLTYRLLDHSFYKIKIQQNLHGRSQIPKDIKSFKTKYNHSISTFADIAYQPGIWKKKQEDNYTMNADRHCDQNQNDSFIEYSFSIEMDFTGLQDFALNPEAVIVDVREPGEQPGFSDILHIAIPLSVLWKRMEEIKGSSVLFICNSGYRSMEACRLFKNYFKDKKTCFSLKSGIVSLFQDKLG